MSLAVQRFLAALVVDGSLFDRFRASPLACAQSFGLAAAEAELAATTNAAQVAVFREVVEGTRTIQFRGWFPTLASALGESGWTSLLHAFHSDVSIRNPRKFADAKQFCDWVSARHAQTLAADMVIHDLAVLVASAASRSPTPEDESSALRPSACFDGQSFALGSHAVPFVLNKPIECMQQPTIDIFEAAEIAAGSEDGHFYLVHAEPGSEGAAGALTEALTISELDHATHAFVRQLYLPPWHEGHVVAAAAVPGEAVAFADLVDAQVLVPRHA